MRDNPERGELDAQMMSTYAARRIPLPLHPALVRGQKKAVAVAVAAKSEQFTMSKTGKGQFFKRHRRNLAEERVVRKVLSSGSIAGMPYLCNDRANELETWEKKSAAAVLASKSASSLLESPA